MTVRKQPSRSALKRAAGIRHTHPYGITRDGLRDAVRDFRRGYRGAYPDASDFFGVRMSDSTSGWRYVSAYNESMWAMCVRFAGFSNELV